MTLKVKISKAPAPKILVFDIETRRVGFHSAGRFAPDGCEPIAIAWSWVGKGEVRSECLEDFLNDDGGLSMLQLFCLVYNAADIVCGHYIRKFDLPILNGSMLENGLPPLKPKLVIDTKQDLLNFAGLSKSQENLSGMLRLMDQKHHMSDFQWREATRLTPDGIEETRRRVIDDVKQSKALLAKLQEGGWLRPPRVWKP